MGLAKACFSLFRVGIGWYLWSWRRKELPVAVPPASEAKSRGAEHPLLLPSSHASDSLQLQIKKTALRRSFCGAGGSRTLVQTSDRCAFYMLILWLIVGPALDTGTQGRP